jgi:hypothetical protein
MANVTRNFIAGRMNKIVDQRLLPDGEYIDAMNVRMGSTENSEVGVITNTKGNESLTTLKYIDGTPLSTQARCIGAMEDSANETIYWFVHDPAFTIGDTGKLDLIVSFNVLTNVLTYHIISIDDGGGVNTTLNFNPSYLITGINLIDNLLFWTDDYNVPQVGGNPPRYINIRPIGNRYPNPIGNIDQFTAESILVIKKPPVESPQVTPITTSGQENYLETRFICFAYRYKYVDGEYSATSQWSAPAFVPNPFSFSINSMLNEGMTNSCNTAIINFNTGGPLVVGIDLLFKQSENNVIKVIQQIDKADAGYGNNQVQQYSFNNSKIFTVLNEAEILRLYDNVPRFAKAQTIMGNRLMYGNYVEGYDLIDKNGQPTKIEYSTSLISEVIGDTALIDSTGNGVYNIDPADTFFSVNSSIITFDLAASPLVEGAAISLDVTITHGDWTGDTPYPDEVTDGVVLQFSFLLTRNYTSVYELATSAEFTNAIGTSLNILPVSTTIVGVDTSCSGITFTDSFNCALPNNLGAAPNTFTKYASGINAITSTLQPIAIITTPGSTIIGLQFPAMVYVDDISAPTIRAYEYYRVTFANVSFQEIANPRSLHSNRGYEIGLVYMDDFNRATTALVSTNNAEHVACGFSPYKNSIQVVIPFTQIAPAWATRYKFVIKADAERYETIYSNLFFINPETNEAWLLLEGENMRKVENGDRLIVKSDTQGPTLNCVYTTVLDKQAQAENFIEIPNPLVPTEFIKVPAGLYIRVTPNTFSLEKTDNALIAPGNRQVYGSGGDHVFLSYPMNIAGTDPANPTFTFLDYTVPPGSRVDWLTDWNRGGIRSCEARGYNLEKSYTSAANYDNMYEWFVGDNIQITINTGYSKGPGTETNVFIPGYARKLSDDLTGTTTSTATNRLIDSTATFISDGVVPGVRCIGSLGAITVTDVVSETELILSANSFFSSGQPYRIKWLSGNINFWKFYRNPTTNELTIIFSSTNSCPGSDYKYSRRIYVTANIQVFRAENTLIFETEPADALPDVFFENELSLAIDANGNHLGNIQNQDFNTQTSEIIDTQFFNCYAFGNGVESYKIRDSLTGRSFSFGERVTTVAAQDYKAADRFSDITYSGIYNGESNINKLNEFNSGLSNFKHCESSFGEIQLLDGRNTDVLTLQEDKISYVLAEKNLLSDASAGGIITATPEVLGTQIARTEKYGISFNPESYVQWGFDRYFTDAKRGAVIQLKGGDSSNEQLVAISEQSMRTWFRDKFNASFNYQKLGGFDPYMNEYVLSINDRPLPLNPQCLACGTSQTFTLSVGDESSKSFTYCVDLGPTVGYADISWRFSNIEEGKTFEVTVDYNGTIETSGPVDTDGTISFNKNNILIETATITIEYTGDMVVDVLADCCNTETLYVVEVVVNNNSEAGQTIHTQYRYTNGAFIGPLLSNLVQLSSGTTSPIVSRYNITSGFVGTGGFPPEFSDMRLSTNAISPDNFVFNIAENKFKYLRSDVLYNNTSVEINTLLSDNSLASPNGGSAPLYYADFEVPSNSLGQYLYLIWDLRIATLTELCYVEDDNKGSCCDCTLGNYYLNGATLSEATGIFLEADMINPAPNGFYSTGGVVRELLEGVLLPTQLCRPCGSLLSLCFGVSEQDVCCNCTETCDTPYNLYDVVNNESFPVTVYYYNEIGVLTSFILSAAGVFICSIGTPYSSSNITATFNSCGCDE